MKEMQYPSSFYSNPKEFLQIQAILQIWSSDGKEKNTFLKNADFQYLLCVSCFLPWELNMNANNLFLS